MNSCRSRNMLVLGVRHKKVVNVICRFHPTRRLEKSVKAFWLVSRLFFCFFCFCLFFFFFLVGLFLLLLPNFFGIQWNFSEISMLKHGFLGILTHRYADVHSSFCTPFLVERITACTARCDFRMWLGSTSCLQMCWKSIGFRDGISHFVSSNLPRRKCHYICFANATAIRHDTAKECRVG